MTSAIVSRQVVQVLIENHPKAVISRQVVQVLLGKNIISDIVYPFDDDTPARKFIT